MAQTHPNLPLEEKALSAFHSDMSNALAAIITSFSGASAPTSPAPADGRLWYDTANNTLNIRLSSTWQTLLTKALANIGTTVLATATGDFAAGLVGGNQIFWDQSTGFFFIRAADSPSKIELGIAAGAGNINLYDSSDVLRIVMLASAGSIALKNASAADRVVLNGADGYVNIGGATDASARGDFAAEGASHKIVFDESAGTFNVNTVGAGGARASLGPSANFFGRAGVDIDFRVVSADGDAIDFDYGANTVTFNDNLADMDQILNGADREVARVDASTNSLRVRCLSLMSESVTIASGVATITGSLVAVTGEGGGADTLHTITRVGVTTGDYVIMHEAAGSGAITFTETGGNIQMGADATTTDEYDRIMLVYDGTYWVRTSGLNNN